MSVGRLPTLCMPCHPQLHSWSDTKRQGQTEDNAQPPQEQPLSLPSLPFRGKIFCGYFSTQESSRFVWLLPNYRWCPPIQPPLLLPGPSAAHLCFLSKAGAICTAGMFSMLTAPFLSPFYKSGFSNSSGSTSNLVFYDSVKRGGFHL